jgi:hypothetical protein
LGPAVFGGEPLANIELRIDAEATMEFRRLRARGVTDGTIVRATRFSVGTAGFDPNDYLAALPVNPNATALDNIQFTSDIDHIEWPNSECLSCYCLLETGEANWTLGEIAIIGEVQQSSGDPVDGTEIVMAIGHFPMLAKNSSMQYALRVTIQA